MEVSFMLNISYKILVFSLFTLLCSNVSATYFYGKRLPFDTKEIVVLGDLHRDNESDPQAQKQRQELLVTAKAKNAYCIVEDIFSLLSTKNPEHALYLYCKRLCETRNIGDITITGDSPLSYFYAACLKNNIAAANCDFRILGNFNQKMENTQTILSLVGNSSLMRNELFAQKLNCLLEAFEQLRLHPVGSENSKRIDYINDSLLNLYTVYLLNESLYKSEHNLYIICVGAGHIKEITELIVNIWPIKDVSQPEDTLIHALGTSTHCVHNNSNLLSAFRSVYELALKYPLNIFPFFNANNSHILN